jgi:hypothetical protein
MQIICNISKYIFHTWPPASRPMHRHSGVWHFSPVSEHSSIGLGPLFRVQNWLRHRRFSTFRNLTDQVPESLAFGHLKNFVNEEGLQVMKKDTPAHPYTAAGDVILHLRCWKIILKNARMLREKLVRHRHFIVSQLLPSGIDIPASGQRHRWVQISPALPNYEI